MADGGWEGGRLGEVGAVGGGSEEGEYATTVSGGGGTKLMGSRGVCYVLSVLVENMPLQDSECFGCLVTMRSRPGATILVLWKGFEWVSQGKLEAPSSVDKISLRMGLGCNRDVKKSSCYLAVDPDCVTRFLASPSDHLYFQDVISQFRVSRNCGLDVFGEDATRSGSMPDLSSSYFNQTSHFFANVRQQRCRLCRQRAGRKLTDVDGSFLAH